MRLLDRSRSQPLCEEPCVRALDRLRRQLCETDAANEWIKAPNVEAVCRESSRADFQPSRFVEPPRKVLADADAWRSHNDSVFAIPPQLP
jgi:hypothetical protein